MGTGACTHACGVGSMSASGMAGLPSTQPCVIFPTVFLSFAQFPVAFAPRIISAISEARVSVNRITDFLLLDELEDRVLGAPPGAPEPVAVDRASFAWGPGDAPVVANASLVVNEGELVIVTGPVGCGKVRLLLLKPGRGGLGIGDDCWVAQTIPSVLFGAARNFFFCWRVTLSPFPFFLLVGNSKHTSQRCSPVFWARTT